MEVCYRYAGIGHAMMGMDASDWAAWAGAIGSLVAVWAAFSLYKRSKTDAQEDAATKRRVLIAMLKDHVVLAIVDVGQNIQKLEHTLKSTQAELWNEDLPAMLKLRNQDRMFELQSELLASAQEGDIALARFIEACRAYETQRVQLGSAIRYLDGPNQLVANMQKHFIGVLLACAHEVQRLADDAMASV